MGRTFLVSDLDVREKMCSLVFREGTLNQKIRAVWEGDGYRIRLAHDSKLVLVDHLVDG